MPFDVEKIAPLVQQAGVIGVLLFIICAAATKRIVFWWQYADMQKDRDTLRLEVTQLRMQIELARADRDDWRDVAQSAIPAAHAGRNVVRRAAGVAVTTADLLNRLEAAEQVLAAHGWMGETPP